MPRQATKQQQINNLQSAYDAVQRESDRYFKEAETLKARLKEVACENESLRMDKKWLQSMLSNTIQTLPEMFRNRNALPR